MSSVQEWGDPRKEEYYYYMKSYSPVDNVSADFTFLHCKDLLN
jgi:protease II